MGLIKGNQAVNAIFMLIAVGSLIFSSWRIQPCSCPGQQSSHSGSVTVVAGGKVLRIDTGPAGPAESRKIRVPRKVIRSDYSGSYWALGSWGRVIRTSSGCWAYPTHNSYAVECYERLLAKRDELFIDVEHLQSLRVVEAKAVSKSGAPAGAVTIGEKLAAKKKSAKHGAGSNASLIPLPTVVQRFHVTRTSCVPGHGTFNFTCAVRLNVRFDTETPRAPPPEVCFVTIGDWGEPKRSQRVVADMVAELADMRMVKFIVSTGDNFYPAGVQSSADPQWIQTFETPFAAPPVANVRWYISLGNHDQWGYMAQKVYGEDHARWYLPNYAYTDTIPLYHDASKVSNETIELVVLNSAGRDISGQIQMADEFLGSIDSRSGEARDRSRHWRLVVNHEPIYSGGLHGLLPERNGFVRNSIQPVLQQHMAHAYFNGDDHFLEIHRYAGTDFFTSGGGCGSEVYTTTMRPTTKWNMFSDFLPKDVPALEIVVDGAMKRASAKGVMLHCAEGPVLRTHVVDENGAVMHVYETRYDTDPQEFLMEIEE